MVREIREQFRRHGNCGRTGFGMGGTLTDQGSDRVFQLIHEAVEGQRYVFIDMGAGCGLVQALALTLGRAVGSVGVELGFYDSSNASEIPPGLGIRSPRKASPLAYNAGAYNKKLREGGWPEFQVRYAKTGASVLGSLDELVEELLGPTFVHCPQVVYAFCDGWTPGDRDHMLSLVAAASSTVSVFFMSPGRGKEETITKPDHIINALHERMGPHALRSWYLWCKLAGAMQGSQSKKHLYVFRSKSTAPCDVQVHGQGKTPTLFQVWGLMSILTFQCFLCSTAPCDQIWSCSPHR